MTTYLPNFDHGDQTKNHQTMCAKLFIVLVLSQTHLCATVHLYAYLIHNNSTNKF